MGSHVRFISAVVIHTGPFPPSGSLTISRLICVWFRQTDCVLTHFDWWAHSIFASANLLSDCPSVNMFLSSSLVENRYIHYTISMDWNTEPCTMQPLTFYCSVLHLFCQQGSLIIHCLRAWNTSLFGTRCSYDKCIFKLLLAFLF